MPGIPVDSAEAREMREAAAEVADYARAARVAEVEALRAHRSTCVAGWLGEDTNGRPKPCLICRPHLIPSNHMKIGIS